MDENNCGAISIVGFLCGVKASTKPAHQSTQEMKSKIATNNAHHIKDTKKSRS